MADSIDDAVAALRDALASSAGPVRLSLTMSRATAEKVVRLLEAERTSGAVVVPVKEFYTTTESAALLGISRASLMKLIESGDIDSFKVGTHHRVPADGLLAFQRTRQVSRERASELLNEFAARSTHFQSNVTFRTEGQNSNEAAEGHGSRDR